MVSAVGRTEVRLAGFGGQGVVLAGVCLGHAAMLDGYYAVQTQSYGAEARGGAARSEIVVSRQAILYPEVTAPDFMAALSQPAVDKYLGDLRPQGTLVVDDELVSRLDTDARTRVLKACFTEVAGSELGRPIVANMVMLGFLTEVADVVSAASLDRAVAEQVPKGTAELNLKAVNRGRELAAAAAAAAPA
jgi:2-oxoglutarate ferredoxin oxidoreductase subunit gamma